MKAYINIIVIISSLARTSCLTDLNELISYTYPCKIKCLIKHPNKIKCLIKHQNKVFLTPFPSRRTFALKSASWRTQAES